MNIDNPKVTQKKARISLILGTLSILFPSIWIISELILEKSFLLSMEDMSKIVPLPLFVFEMLNLGLFIAIFVLPGIMGIIGLILGLKSLKSAKKIMPILGISLCGIGILVWMYEILVIYALLQG